MNAKVREVLDIFKQISAIPRCSKHEEEISQWLQDWAKDHGLAVRNDRAGNVVIKVPATPGFEGRPGIVIQGHIDMVCEKTSDSDHDFSKDPIRLVYDGEWLKADQTTLGADNGIAIAMGLALAGDPAVAHPPLELLFTVDEETGLTGAGRLDPALVEGRILLNIDSEDEGILTIGCAGGRDTRITLPLTVTKYANGQRTYKLRAYGMRGGHSGVDIHKHRANANQILARALKKAKTAHDIRLLSVKGGSAHNAIPREAAAVLTCEQAHFPGLGKAVADFEQTVRSEFLATEPSLALSISPTEIEADESFMLTGEDTDNVINLLLALPHGVAGMSATIEGLVETSNNLATVEIRDGALHVHTSQRSSMMTRLDEITSKIAAVAALAGADTESGNGYPAWQPDKSSPLLTKCIQTYKKLFGREPAVEAIHAGLECGIIGSKYSDMDMISFGPTIENPHSPDERIHIPSIASVWDFLVELLKS